jgi:hypothetical protein
MKKRTGILMFVLVISLLFTWRFKFFAQEGNEWGFNIVEIAKADVPPPPPEPPEPPTEPPEPPHFVGCEDCDPLTQFCCVDGNTGQCYNEANQICCNGKIYSWPEHECCKDGTYEWECEKYKCKDCNFTTHGCDYRCKPENCEECVSLLGNPPACHECGGDGTKCCVSGHCTERCGGGCCEPNQYCCGDIDEGQCCNADEVCCWGFDGSGGIYHYCNPPCRDEITDSTTCSKNNENDYKCDECGSQINPPTCGTTYREYTGLIIETCYDGCPQFDWNDSYEICYQEKQCTQSMAKQNSMCMECNGKHVCIPIIGMDSGLLYCQTAYDCIIQVGCNVLYTCYQCENSDTVVGPPNRKETCNCK